jgi:alpha-tubulin suppressor-like RCC1 family protein
MVEGLGDPATEIGCGTAVSFAVTNTGNAFSWGMGNNGQVILN